ncbi:MAG: YidB family protein [Isosphaeraceae bacterium]|nr:YidB family protein [Isosphaeraceae bacterium]
MSLLDEVNGLLGNVLGKSGENEAAGAAAPSGLVEHVFGIVRSQGLTMIFERFSKSGLGEIAASWVGKGENLPIDASKLREALGDGTIQALAERLGLPLDRAGSLLAQALPMLVDKMTPEGTLEGNPFAAAAEVPAEESPRASGA